MGITALIVFVLAIAGAIVWFFIKNKKEPNVQPKKSSEAASQPSAPPVDDTSAQQEQPKEEPKEEVKEEQKPMEEEEPVVSKPKPDAPKPPVVEEKPKYDEEFESYIGKYSKFAKIERDSYTYRWFYELFREAKSQLRVDTSHGLPILLRQENFPTLYEWGDVGDPKRAQDTLIGWLFSLQFAELKPYYRADIFKVGYEMGGYDRYTNIYGWKFEHDPNIMRILAGAIYPAMKGYCKPVTETMRKEVEGTMYGRTLKQLYTDEKRDNVAPKDFFTDFRVFMPTAPAPYAPGYSKRPDRTYPNEPRDEYDNLKVDRQIHEMIVENYNLNQPEHCQETVQAIADKEAASLRKEQGDQTL